MSDGETIWQALAKAKAELPSMTKSANNPFFKSKYVPLEAILDTVEPILARHGLIIFQEPTCVQVDADALPALTTSLLHVSDAAIRSSTMLVLPTKADPQGQGAAITYARRYAIVALLELNVEKDDDGETAQGRGTSRPKEPPTSPASPPTSSTPGDLSSFSGEPFELQGEAAKKPRRPTAKQTAVQLRNKEWEQLADQINEAETEAAGKPSRAMTNKFYALARGKGLVTPDEVHGFLSEATGRTIHSYTECNREELNGAIDLLSASERA